ncbi:MAG: 50S ribosomal protein L20 [Opitutales bacterium]
MPRATNGPATKARKRRTIASAKGYFGNKSRLYVYALEATQRAQKFAYRDRRKNKSTFRQLWIVRLNAACRPLGITYSRLIAGLKKADIIMDRKNLSELAINDAPAFEAIVQKAKAALA